MIKGLKELYKLFQDNLENANGYLDPNHLKEDRPARIDVLQYTLNFTEYPIWGDTTVEAMIEFCKLYETVQPKNNLLDTNIVRVVEKNKKLRLASSPEKADGFYIYRS